MALLISAQDLLAQQKGKLRGSVQKSGKNSPLPFATVGVYTQKDSLVGGGIADEKGNFEVDLPLGSFYALVEFMGFEAQCTKSLLLLVRHSHAVKQAQLSKSFKYCRGDER